jgi:DNA-directed RNA polymerase subunit RPC12/RpoP
MAADLTCPICKHRFARPADSPGNVVICPACHAGFPPRQAAGPSLLARAPAAGPGTPAPAPNPNRTLLAEPEAMVRYTCPRCKKSLESPASFAGQKLNCPDCGQRLQIPQPSTPPAVPPLNKTILASEEPAGPVVPAAPPQSASPRTPSRAEPTEVEAIEEDEVPADRGTSARVESCLECGVNLARRSRVQTCPDCGSLFCSARCFREHRHHAHASRKKPRPRYVECPYCGTTEPPREVSEISQGGWITFALLLVFFFPLCWIGLLMTETRLKCSDCGARLD